MKNKILIAVILFCSVAINAQEESSIDNLIEQIVSSSLAQTNEGEVVDMSQLRYELEQLASNPISINSEKIEVLTRLGLLNTEQFFALQKHISVYGKIYEVEELQVVGGFSYEVIQMIIPFVTFNSFIDSPEIKKKIVFQESRKDLLIHYQRLLEMPDGYKGVDPKYSGDISRIMVRWNMMFYKKWRFGLNMEKDSGERFGWNPEKQRLVFDHVSGFLQYKGNGLLKNAILGDFNAGFAQGLTFRKGLSFGKSANSVPIRKVTQGLRPHTGIDESLFMRGFGFTIGLRNIMGTGFFSYRNLDANPLVDSSSVHILFSSIQSSGYHRTESEINNAKLLSEYLVGGNISLNQKRVNVGFTFVYQSLGAELKPRESLYRVHYFTGKSNWVGGANFNTSIKNMAIFGEVSASANQKFAYLFGATISPDPKYSFTIYNRWFQKEFQPIYSQAFGESSVNRNESGIYFAWEYIPKKRHKLTGYFDLFSFPWITSNADAPGTGSEFLAQYLFKPSKKWEVILRYRNKQLEKNSPLGFNDLMSQSYNQFRIQFQIKPYKFLLFRSRLEMILLKNSNINKGYLFYLDAVLKPIEKPYSFSIRYSIFNTPNYDTRIYAYERDVYYTYSVKPYFGNGRKVYFISKWRFKRIFTFVFRIDQSFFPFQEQIGSGNEMIEKNHKTGVKLQLRIRW